MTHEPEAPFGARVVNHCIESFGITNVDAPHRFDESNRVVDLWVKTPIVTLAIEVENDFESVTTGVGQALLYAAHEHNAVPVVVVPPGHVEQPEADLLRRYVPIVELDV